MINPSISIVIPTYDRPLKLLAAVNSALTACPSNGEVLVVDDRSDTARQALSDVVSDPQLIIMDNTLEKGAAGARNFGVANAKSDIILFLDDDDEMILDYPSRVLAAAEQTDVSFGFANVRIVNHSFEPPVVSLSRRSRHLPQGLIAHDLPLEKKVFATSYGFWIRRHVFEDVGGIQTDQIVDEDTDLACRLYGNGYRGWFEALAAMIVHQRYSTADGTSPHLSIDTDAAIIAACYARTFERNQHLFSKSSEDRWFLFRRALRNCAQNGVDDVAQRLLGNGSTLSFRVRGWLYWRLKKAGKTLRHRR